MIARYRVSHRASASASWESQRRRMIAEHSAFLTWALAHRGELPAIPRRRLDRGGFGPMLRRPGARAAVEHWWRRVLAQMGM